MNHTSALDVFHLDSLPTSGRALILCATSRLAQSLRTRYNQTRAQHGEQRWATLDARTVSQWLGSLAEELQLRGAATHPDLKRRVLDGFQERLLWERVINDALNTAEQALFDTPAMAATAAEAHALAVEWGVQVAADHASDENRRFQDWQARFIGACQKHGWIDSARQQKALISCLAEAQLPWPDHVLFAGFDRFTPLELGLQRVLRARGTVVGPLEAPAESAALHAVSYPDTTAEYLAAGLWAQQHLAANPQARLGIVVPDLAGNRDRIQDTLDDLLAPHAIRPGLAEVSRPFNISLGRALNCYPLVSTAIDLLRLLNNARLIEQNAFSQLLRSPYWSADSAEADSRAFIEAELRQGVAPKASLARLAGFVGRLIEKNALAAQHLTAHLGALQASAGGFKKPRAPSLWAKAFLAALRNAGWLAEHKLSSHEYQTRQAFLEEIRKLAGLDSLLNEIDAATALSHLNRLCSERVFQPKTEGNPPLQVLGLLEASGLQFDALWITGMIDSAWPPPARPNPLLSAEAQRKAESPNAGAVVQLAFANSVHQRLSHSAPDITFSWPRNEGATELRASPLLSDVLPHHEDRDAPASPHWAVHAANNQGRALAEPFTDATAPAVRDGEKVRGGTWLLRAQAICPAWAYFQYRLGAGKLPEPVEGLDAAKRGTLVHDTLEAFWKSVVTSTQLKALGNEKRMQRIIAAVDQVLDDFDKDSRQEPFKPQFRALERQRLIKLIQGWLELELERSQAFTVIACERRVSLEIEGIAANMQIDRIDQLDDGRLLVIDYKTGARIDIKNWASDRITEPQLPIYAAIAKPEEGPVAAVVFAKVLLQEPAFSGLGEAPDLLPRLTVLDSNPGRRLFSAAGFPDWPSVLTHWHDCIHAIAHEVKAGDASIRFEDDKNLRYCDVRPLLRLAERTAQMERAGAAEQPAT